MIRRPPRSTLSSSSAASDVYKRQLHVSAYELQRRDHSPLHYLHTTLPSHAHQHGDTSEAGQNNVLPPADHEGMRPHIAWTSHLLTEPTSSCKGLPTLPHRHPTRHPNHHPRSSGSLADRTMPPHHPSHNPTRRLYEKRLLQRSRSELNLWREVGVDELDHGSLFDLR